MNGDGSDSDITQLLLRWNEGDRSALSRLMPLVSRDLVRIASRQFSRERSSHTLQPTALVNEVYLRLVDQKRVSWRNRAHFFALCAQMMRRELVSHARKHRSDKRGGGAVNLSLEDALRDGEPGQEPGTGADLVDLDAALEELAVFSPRQARGVELRFFGGLKVREVAEVLGISLATVKLDWKLARAWLFQRLVVHGSSEGA